MNLSLCSWKRKVTSYVNPARSLALQEDEHFIIPEYPSEAQVPGHRDSLIGLFDGHGGRGTVDFVSMALPQNLQKVLRRKEAQENIPRALWAAFLLTDIQTKSCVVDTCSGSTAVCCLLRQIPRTEGGGDKGAGPRTFLHVANCGDSRAVLCRDGRPIRLTYDHKADDLFEQKRIARANGFTHKGRTLGILAVSRSFGDHAFKEFVIAEPHLSSLELGGRAADPFLIVCCDGIWDVISDEEAVDMVSAISKRQREAEEAEEAAEGRMMEEAEEVVGSAKQRTGTRQPLAAVAANNGQRQSTPPRAGAGKPEGGGAKDPKEGGPTTPVSGKRSGKAEGSASKGSKKGGPTTPVSGKRSGKASGGSSNLEREAAKWLCDEALRRGTTDNLSAIVIFF